ncbi:hypothetical protein IF090_11715 [Acinetobacter towneri]|uniref:hypothetical protein n=1 Tax=Acinetobacter towneri TaxID=202956 RepID=UPI001CE08D43|nr:hypothetical protein [Acinetobacter towneri]MCA4780291.1 hypothetical protein [Acinetobacter towneri]MCA4785651.1 hypothetical protein [Acinetobacter towneri]MCA4787515.1 hypothetical protein [Acinetobacter towneri]MCA4796797.1 hypothetical protein [Acinetobacter towneri]MCA4801844.1 hypothetical protein [Acinetobacter towneri]
MDIQELNQFESVYQPSKEIAFCWGAKKYVQLSVEENHTEIVDHANDSLRIWQAAKAQAIPEGFMVVLKEPTPKMIDAADNCAIDGKVTANIVYKAMIEPQEPAK